MFRWGSLLFFALFATSLFGQNRLSLDTREADSLFVAHNLTLIAARYNVDIADALAIQAGLFDNPSLSYEQVVYNGEANEWLNVRSQYAFELEQVIGLSGQRFKAREVARYDVEKARFEFEQLLRELRYLLHANLIAVHYADRSIALYENEISSIEGLLKVYELQLAKGNVSLIEKSRLEALYFALKSEQHQLLDQRNELHSQLRLLLNVGSEVRIEPRFDGGNLADVLIDTKVDAVVASLPKMQIADLMVRQEESNVSLQKRLAVPNIAIKGVFDKASNIALNYYGIGLAIDLPLFNRNQGNIRAAEAQVKQNKISYEAQLAELTGEIQVKIDNLQRLHSFYLTIDRSLEENLTTLIAGVNDSFQKRNINMLEFIDYYETYKETCLKIYEQEQKIHIGIAEINMLFGYDYIKTAKGL